jgi:transposase
LDVHKTTVCVAIAESGRGGEVREVGVFENRPDVLRKMVARLGKHRRRLNFCYEAGPCGYGLQRSDHPLRAIRGLVNEALVALEREFAVPSIAPEKLLRAMLLQAFYSIRSERQLMERLEFDLLFRWFVGIGVDDAAWDHSVFSKNRERLLEGDIAAKLLSTVLAHPRVKRLLSTDHFSVDGTLIEAWASMKSFKPKDGSDEPPADGDGRNREADFHGEKRSNDTHACQAVRRLPPRQALTTRVCRSVSKSSVPTDLNCRACSWLMHTTQQPRGRADAFRGYLVNRSVTRYVRPRITL